MSDGSRLRNTWHSALKDAESRFKRLYSASSPEWKRISSSKESVSKGKLRIPESADVVIHRKLNKSGDDVYRLVLDVPIPADEPVSLEPWHAVLTTPELRKEWDPAVEQSQFIETFDWTTKVCKTNFTLGWPANPRDAVTICRTYHDPSTVIYISTSLPRSPDEPAYLRPSPPYVRSNVTLFAWCIQHIQPQPPPTTPATRRTSVSLASKLRITCFSQHDFKFLWTNSSTTLSQELSTMMLGLLKTVNKRKARVPVLVGSGNGVSLDRMKFQIDREALEVDYCIVPPDDEHDHASSSSEGNVYAKGIEEIREQRRLTRSVECVLPASEGWDVQITTKASSEAIESLPWSAHAFRRSSVGNTSTVLDQIVLKITHSPLPDEHAVLRVRLIVEISASSSRPSAIGLRLNGLPQTVSAVEERDPSTTRYLPPSGLDLGPQPSTGDASISEQSMSSASSSIRVVPVQVGLSGVERSAAAEKSVLSRVKRNYIYFSSLLQEPEAKWRHTSDARGVSVTQLDSIDPTLVVYRAEATFVGVSMWDLYSALVSPGAKIVWDKLHEDSILLEDVNELTELWHYKSKPAWPSNGRDAVVLRTVYKSPTTIHVFSFSTASDPSDNHLFPTVPLPEPNVIRTQIDLQGWAIEALSPTTTALTLLEQSDPKGWTNKTTAPSQMINTLAGIGEFAIKCGGPPMVTRLFGGRKRDVKYDHERMNFRAEYEAAIGRTSSGSPTSTADPSSSAEGSNTSPMIECEIRCDLDTWASSLDIVIDPPPQSISCLKRHRVSAAGGGLWITITHDAVFVADERVLVIVRRGTGVGMGASRGDKSPVVMVNGARVPVDVEEMAESEIRSMTRQKRVKPPRIPLDQPPVVGIVRKRKAEWDKDQEGQGSDESSVKSKAESSSGAGAGSNGGGGGGWASAPKISSPLSRFFTYAVDQATTSTQQAVAAITPGVADAPISSKPPLEHALNALSWVQHSYSRSIPITPATTSSTTTIGGWTPVSDKQGVCVRRNLDSRISRTIPVHKGEKVIQGVSADELMSIVSEYECKKKWDDRLDESRSLESFGSGSGTAFVAYKAGFPFRDRGFYVTTVSARMNGGVGGGAGAGDVEAIRAGGIVGNGKGAVRGGGGGGTRNVLFHVSSSFHPDSAGSFAASKYNPYGLPIGRVYVDAWVFETLDPYTKENYEIPSTRCTRYVAVDYAGSIPAAVNTLINATLPRTSIVGVEGYLRVKKGVERCLPMMRLPCAAFVLTVDRKKDEEEDEEDEKGVVGAVEAHVHALVAWKFKRKDENRVLVMTRYSSEESVYRSRILLTMSPAGTTGMTTSSSAKGTARRQRSRHGSQTTPRPSRIGLNESTFTPPLPEDEEGVPAATSNETVVPSGSMLQPGGTTIGTSGSSSSMRGRSSSASAFTMKGEVRQSTDLIVGEIVLDSKLYPTGYDVKIRSRLMVVHPQQPTGRVPLTFDAPSAVAQEVVLPISYTIYTLPPSPLHGSSADDDSAPRHLIRMVLPTAQYQHQISVVEDPLTGETRSGIPRPEWLVDMMDRGIGALVDVEIKPLVGVGGGVVVKGKGGGGGVSGMKVVGEKESLTKLGRDELLDDRGGRMGVLTRVAMTEEGADVLPEELKTPVGVAVELLDPQEIANRTGVNGSTAGNGNRVATEDASNGQGGAGTEAGDINGDLSPSTPMNELSVIPSPQGSSSPLTSSGLLGFFHTNPLSRLTQASTTMMGARSLSMNGGAGAAAASRNASASSSRRSSGVFGGGGHEPPGGLGLLQDGKTMVLAEGGSFLQRRHPLSTVIIVGLISFLIGSLLRSLLSPADFVYVVDGGAVEEGMGGGWRELRRLIEIKYVYGGWDLQIGAVRRH